MPDILEPQAARTVTTGGATFAVTPAYREGAQAARAGAGAWANPYRCGSQRADDWDAGHENESTGAHAGMGPIF